MSLPPKLSVCGEFAYLRCTVEQEMSATSAKGSCAFVHFLAAHRSQFSAKRRAYSNLSASIGSVAAAFVAGYHPKKIPIAAEKLNAISDTLKEVRVGQPRNASTP